jgi:hypothetical protein
VDLTPEDFDRLETKELANVIRKLKAEKTLPASERALLAREKARAAARGQTFGNPTPPLETFVSTWNELAQQLGVTRRALQDWRDPLKRPDLAEKWPRPQADGRHSVTAWFNFIVEHGLARADEDVDPEDLPPERRTVRDWKQRREELLCAKLERDIAREDELLLIAAELEMAVGQLLSGLSTALNHLPGSAARFVTGLRDPHAVQAKLQVEVDAVLQRLYAARYIDQSIAEEIAALPDDAESAALCDKLLFTGADRGALLGLVERLTRAAFARLGRRALADITGAPRTIEVPAEPVAEPTPAKIPKSKATCRRKACPKTERR